MGAAARFYFPQGVAGDSADSALALLVAPAAAVALAPLVAEALLAVDGRPKSSRSRCSDA
jgi:hypothetical protein